MPPNMKKRIINEIADVNNDTTTTLAVCVPNDDDICTSMTSSSFAGTNFHVELLDNLLGSLDGPPDTPYEGK